MLRISQNRRLAAALSGITASVFGVIGSLAIAFGQSVLFPAGLAAPDWGAIGIAALAFLALRRTPIDVLWLIAGGAALGLFLGFV